MKEITIPKNYFKDFKFKIEVDICCIPLRDGFAEDCGCAWCELQKIKFLYPVTK